MTPIEIGVIGIVVLLILFAAGMPVGYSMLLVGFVGFSYMTSLRAGISVLAQDCIDTLASYGLSVVPMFILMGTVAFHSGMTKRLFEAGYRTVGHMKGGLVTASILASAGFAAICGSTIAGAAAMGKVALPEMRRYKYDDSLASGSLAAAGSLSILIPPSAVLIVYGILVQESIGRLFAAGVIPGVLLTGLFVLAVTTVCTLNPDLAPAAPKSKWVERMLSIGRIVDILLLFVCVMGGLFGGLFTPTEAGAMGAFGILILAATRRQLNYKAVSLAVIETLRISAMVFLIVLGATVFGKFMSITRLPFELAEWVTGLKMSRVLVMGIVIVGYLILGCFMDSLAMVTLTVPIVYPLIIRMGFDAIWFGIVIVLVAEMGVITPPVGINVYTIKGVAPDIPLETIFKGIFPFLLAEIACVAILLAWPEIALFLPRVFAQ